MAFIVSSLPDFSKIDKEQLLMDVVLGGRFKQRMTLQTSVKKVAQLNYLSTSVTLADGSSCGFSAAGNDTFTYRSITTGAIKVNKEWCPAILLGKYTEYMVSISANPNAERMPFEQELVELITKNIVEKSEALIWWGDTTKTSDTDLKWHDGLVKLALADNSVHKFNNPLSGSAFDAVKAVIMAIPAKLLKDTEVYVAPSLFRMLSFELMEKNLFHYSNDNMDELVFPSTTVKVVSVDSLEMPAGWASDKDGVIFAANPKELFFGCDLDNAEEDARIWFSDDADVYRGKWLWNQGVQYAFGDRIVAGAYKDIVSPAGNSASLAAIATSTAAIATSTADLADDDHVFKTKEQTASA